MPGSCPACACSTSAPEAQGETVRLGSEQEAQIRYGLGADATKVTIGVRDETGKLVFQGAGEPAPVGTASRGTWRSTANRPSWRRRTIPTACWRPARRSSMATATLASNTLTPNFPGGGAAGDPIGINWLRRVR
jgi:hypothetical protein